MRLSHIYEGLGAPPGSPQAQQLGAQAQELAGDSAEAATQLRKQLETQQEAQEDDPKLQNQQKRERKNTLSQLASVPWDPNNQKFQKLAARALGSGTA